ncbi:class F sortase [Streptomyces sp. NPDC017230]|uniref:class F sortase n=1 Tax=unclassified Streptomyces TaxID=2593676 RepID=UPI0037AFC565
MRSRTEHRGGPRGGRLTWVAATGLVAGVGMVVQGVLSAPHPPPQPRAQSAAAAELPQQTAAGVRPLGYSRPVRVRVERLGIMAAIRPVGLNSDGTVEVPRPEQAGDAGWYKVGAAPGQTGSAVILGHVDSAVLPGGRAAFYALGAARKGDQVEVDRADGTTARFSVETVTVVAKSDFPTRAVYGPTDTPQLRLVTCGGSYSGASGYSANVIVYAHLTGSGRTTTAEPGRSRR